MPSWSGDCCRGIIGFDEETNKITGCMYKTEEPYSTGVYPREIRIFQGYQEVRADKNPNIDMILGNEEDEKL